MGVSAVNVACVQLAAHDLDDDEEALDQALEAANRAAGAADLVVLPEAVYPAYVLHEGGSLLTDTSWYERATRAFGDVAAAHGAWIAVGLVRPADGALLNSAILFGPEGNIMSIADKSFLWHFDARWFRAGRPGDVVALPWGNVGMVVCADVRMPELPRRLAMAGARLLIDCTALVVPPGGKNAQIEYMLEARARENGSFLAVANKCGTEAGIARYGGRSAILDPSGDRRAEAGIDEPETIVVQIDLSTAPGPGPIAPGASDEPDASGIAAALTQGPPASPLRFAFVRPGTTDPIRVGEELSADLVVVSGREVPSALTLVEGRFMRDGRPLASGTIFTIGNVRGGILTGSDGFAPEPARKLMLGGAALLFWAPHRDDVTTIARTRADENRVFLVSLLPDGSWEVVAPSGAISSRGPDPALDATLVELPIALAWNKEMAPGTHVVDGRPGGSL
jgi:predicted amidohydrolase